MTVSRRYREPYRQWAQSVSGPHGSEQAAGSGEAAMMWQRRHVVTGGKRELDLVLLRDGVF